MLLTARNAIRSGAALVLVACFLWIVFGPTTQDHSSSTSTKAPVVEAIRVPNKQKISTVVSANSTDQSPLPIVDTAALEQKIAFANEMKALRADAYRERVQLLVFDLTRLGDGLASWTQRVADLSTNDSGRRIVTNAQDFPAVVKLLGASLVTDSELETLRREVKLIERSASQNGKSEPSSEMLAAVERSTKQIDAIHKTIERFTASAGQFEKQSLSFELANMTLGEAIKKKENESSMEWAKKLASMDKENNARVEKESAQMATAKANAEIAKRAAIAEGELRQIEADAVAARVAADAKVARIALEAEYQRDVSKVQQYLAPLFATGYTQPRIGGFEQTKTSRPMSLAAIKKFGALDAPDGLSGGFSKFLHLFNDSSNDRQVRGPYPKYIGGVPNQSEVNAIRPAYILLEKYQELLVDKGLLAE